MVYRSPVCLLGLLGVFLAVSGQAKPPVGVPVPGAGPMGRLRTIGYEAGLGSSSYEGSAAGATTLDGTIKRSGATSLKCDSGAGNAGANSGLVVSGVGEGNPLFVRAYFYFPALPTATVTLISLNVGVFHVRLTSGGKLQLANSSLTQVGSDSSATLTTDTWYRIELKSGLVTSGLDDMELRVDGNSEIAVSTDTTMTSHTNLQLGWCTAPGANKVCYVDDLALNDSQGATQNTWPGEGKIVLLKPTADNAVGTGWVDGDGAGTLFGSVDNTPPVGVGTPADGTQIKNLTSTSTGNYDATMTTYAAAGIASIDTVTLVQSLTSHGIIGQTNARNGAVQIVSNPAQSPEESVTMPTVVAGTWPANWKHVWGVAQVGDIATANRGTAPVLRVGKRTATTRENDCCAMLLYVEYVVGNPTYAPPPFQRPARFLSRRRAF